MTTIEKILFAILFIAVAVLGFLVYGVHGHLARIDQNGRDLTEWAAISARWTTEIRSQTHFKDKIDADHKAAGLAVDHVQPPPDPPPIW